MKKCKHEKSFIEKLGLISKQTGDGNIGHFPFLVRQKVPEIVSAKNRDHLQSLRDEYEGLQNAQKSDWDN